MKIHSFKHIKPHRLHFHEHLKFTSADNHMLQCNGKMVQVKSSLPIKHEDNPLVDFGIYVIGK